MLRKGLFKILMHQLKKSVDQALSANPKWFLLIILLIVFLGTIYTLINRSNVTISRTENIESIIPQLPLSDSTFLKNSPGITDLYDILRMESNLERIMEKDSLSKQDSIFIIGLNKKLNNMINE